MNNIKLLLVVLLALLLVGCGSEPGEQVAFNEQKLSNSWQCIGDLPGGVPVYIIRIDGVEYIVIGFGGGIVQHEPKQPRDTTNDLHH